MLKFAKSLIRDRRGSTAVEMAILLVPLSLFVFGIVEVSRLYFVRHELVTLVDKLSRQIILANDSSVLEGWQSFITDNSILIDPTRVELLQTLFSEDGVTYHSLRLTHNFNYLVPLIGTGALDLNYVRTVPLNRF